MQYKDSIHSNDLSDSYYSAYRRDIDMFDRLEGAVDVDVAIVGAGFSGISAALQLAEKGFKVVVLEQNQVGWGASGRNGGQLIGGYGQDLANYEDIKNTFGSDNAKAVFDMGIECVDIVSDVIEKYNIDCDLKWGYLDAAMKKSELKELQETAETMERLGYPHKMQCYTDKSSLKEVIDSNQYMGGLVNMGWGHLQPLDLVRGEARAAQRLGVKIYEEIEVIEIERGDRVSLKTRKGQVSAAQVIVAGNAYLGKLEPKLAARVLPAGSYIIATERLEPEVINRLMPADYAVCDQRWALDYFRMSADGRLLFGGLANYSARHPASIKKALLPNMLKVFPQLDDVRIDYEWGGYIGIGLNRIPQVGQLDHNIYYAQAYSGHGVAPTHMSARLITEAISGDKSRFDIMAKVRHKAFPGGRLFRQPLLAAGMSFYKFRDMIGL
ncbi:FAD-binding oxidoreductase [Temperatibacter marinus]|uniref:FAD-binding oxidoreductase n=1 Tax=Temperatibacter marinus TaxID=1456591 RepID=A0AA52H9Z4_9PROT|nr:FAD-binding oxidoreductase [Temperatibacter marinus]WND02093.1 FAD-binding oxidoreductase [Temperatibacter marinus]